MQQEQEKQAATGPLIGSKRDAVEWLLLAYSLGHPDVCQCEYCLTARALTSPSDEKDQPAVA